MVCQEDVRAGSEQAERRPRLEEALGTVVKTGRWDRVVEAAQALRGVHFTAALTLIAELGDLPRLTTPRHLRSFWDLLPVNILAVSGGVKGQLPRPATPTPAGSASREPGPLATRPRSVVTCTYGGSTCLPPFKTAVGKPRAAFARATGGWSRGASRSTRSSWPSRGKWRPSCGPAPARERRRTEANLYPVRPLGGVTCPAEALRSGGVAAPGGRTPRGTLRGGNKSSCLDPRPLPDGPQSGGTQPTDLRVIDRRHYGLRLFCCAEKRTNETANQRPCHA
jgi:hypothetical protein